MLLGSVEDGVPLSPGEWARETRSLAIMAYFDGEAVGEYGRTWFEMPRRLTLSEAAAWREGYADGLRIRREQEERDRQFAVWATENRIREERRAARRSARETPTTG